jgi:hypothetical protein
MTDQLCGWNNNLLTNYNWHNKGICQTPTKPYCKEIDGYTNYCSTDSTKNKALFNYVEPTQLCGTHWTNGSWQNIGKCTTSNRPCCSSQYSGTCGTTCTSFTNNDYIAPASTVQPSCAVSTWSVCNAPVCNGKQDKTSGTQSRTYTSTSNCISNQSLSQPCETTCPTPKRCGIGSSNNTTKCTQSNDCCSSDGYCGQGPNFCQSNSQYQYCADLDQQKSGYQDNNDKCQTKKAQAQAQTQTQTQAQTQAPIQKPTQAQQEEILSNKQPAATTQCGKDKFGFTINNANVEYGKCKNASECCSGFKGTSFYGWCGPQGNTDYCYDDAQKGYGRVPLKSPW